MIYKKGNRVLDVSYDPKITQYNNSGIIGVYASKSVYKKYLKSIRYQDFHN